MINEDMSLLPGLVRLAFHDCVGNGGCDGCIDITKADNAGRAILYSSVLS